MSRMDGYVRGGYVQGQWVPLSGHRTWDTTRYIVYSRKAADTHPTGMLSCLKFFALKQLKFRPF